MSGKQPEGGQPFLVKAGIIGGFCLLATYSFLYILQDKLLYMPGAPIRFTQENPKGYRSPEERQISYSPIVLQTEDNEIIQGWFMAKADPRSDDLRQQMHESRRLMIFFHENAGNIGLRLDYFQTMYHKGNCDILAIAYRGYSDSSGTPTEQGLKNDANAVMAFALQDLASHYTEKGGVFVVGRSLGGAVAAAAVSKLGKPELSKIDGLVLENTFTSIDDMADVMFSVLAYMKGLVLTNHWRTIDLVPEITLPIFYVSGALDEIVPHEMSIMLHTYTKKSSDLQMWINPDGSHNDTWSINKDNYLRHMIGFFNQTNKNGKLARSQIALDAANSERVKNVKQRAEQMNHEKDRMKQHDSEL